MVKYNMLLKEIGTKNESLEVVKILQVDNEKADSLSKLSSSKCESLRKMSTSNI